MGEAAQVLSFCDREREAVFLHSLCVAEYGTNNVPGSILRVQGQKKYNAGLILFSYGNP